MLTMGGAWQKKDWVPPSFFSNCQGSERLKEAISKAACKPWSDPICLQHLYHTNKLHLSLATKNDGPWLGKETNN